MKKHHVRGLAGILGAITLTLASTSVAARAEDRGTRHGNLSTPVSRAILCHPGGQNSANSMCRRAREAGIYLWQEVQPTGAAMKADPPFNTRGRYSEYRKFSTGTDVCSAGNPANAGLDLLPDSGDSWPTTDLSGVHDSYTFRYDYTAKHPGEYWTMEWYITKNGWEPTDGVSWDELDPTPFMVGHFASLDEYPTDTLPHRTGRHVIVQVWSGPGGPDRDQVEDPQFPKTGEFFTSCSDVDFG